MPVCWLPIGTRAVSPMAATSGVYSRMTVTWRLTLGEVDGEPSFILLNIRDGAWEIEGIIRLDIGAHGRIERICDFQHCRGFALPGPLSCASSLAEWAWRKTTATSGI